MRFGILGAVLVSILGGIAWADGPVPDRRLSLIRDVDFPGGDLQALFDSNLNACQKACLADSRCFAFTFNTRSNACFPKSLANDPTPYDGAFSGTVLETDPAVLANAPARQAELGFLRSGDFDAAKSLALDLTNKHVPNEWTAQDLLNSSVEQEVNGNIVAAYRFMGATTVLTDQADHWAEYARLAMAIDTNNSAERRDYRRRALSAAINGYLRAQADPVRANALSQIAQALEKNGRGRTMIPALRLAQSIQYRQDTAELLDVAVGKYGFRVVDNTVENNSANPRVCAVFNEDLVRAGIDYSPFVKLPSADLIVDNDQRRICIDGVVHGERYKVTFREGLPAASGEILAKNIDVTMYVADRDPSVRFPGRAYILPAIDEIALPVETVNVSELDLALRRVSDRTILRAIQDDYFGRPLSPWQEEDFTAEISTVVWEGTGTVDQGLNQDVTTRLPLTEVVGDLTPGIYVLRAQVPGADPYDTPAASQWFVVSDLGLATMNGTDGLHVFIRGFSDAAAKPGVEVTLLSRANDILATAVTDDAGYAVFAAGLTQGTGGATPAMVLAKSQDDLSFISLTDPEFDLSDRGVEGRAPAGPIDAYMVTDRGAYRAGEEINATVLTRDNTGAAIAGLPLVAILERPDGVEFARALSQNEQAGGHVFAFRTNAAAPRGAWRLNVHVDPDAPAIASAKVLVEDFLPERIDFDLTLPDGPIRTEGTTPLTIDARYLFGAPGGDLPIEGQVLLRTTTELAEYPGYVFGRHDAFVQPEIWWLPGQPRTDAKGVAVIDAEFPRLEQNFRPLEAVMTMRLSEGSGRPVERKITTPVAPSGPVLGIKPNFDGTLNEYGEASFDLIALDTAQAKTEMTVRWEINRVETRYQWYSQGGSWNWEPITRRTRIADGVAQLGDTPVTVAADVKWGGYEIRVERTGANYVAASHEFYAGWYGGADASATPDVLQVSLDAENYRPGDTARLRLVPRYGGKALITVMSNHLIDMKTVEVTEGENIVELPVTDAWGAGAYVTASLVRPMSVEAGRNPARALGLTHAGVDPGARHLQAAFDGPAEVDPRGILPVSLRVDGVAEGETAWVTIAAVDVGILNITGHDAPDASGHYFGQRRLGMGLRDVYGRLIDGMNGAIGQVRSGGDAAPIDSAQSPPPTEELVAYFSGPIQVVDGYARTEFDLPSFNGTVKLMAVVWSGSGVGEAEQDILVRDPVVVTASLPRFLAPGDKSGLLLEIVHATGPAGEMALDLDSDGIRFAGIIPQSVTLTEQGKEVLSIPFTAAQAGLHQIQVGLTVPGGKTLTKTLNLPVQMNDPLTATTHRFQLAAGDTFTFDDNVFDGFHLGTGSATLAAGPIARIDAPGLLQALDRYPYGCTEQTTSRALPLLYLDQVASAMGLGDHDQIDTRVAQAIERVLSRQAANGAFGLWRAQSGDFWLDAYVTDFLSRAKALGHEVPDAAFRTALDNLRNRVNYAPDFTKGGEDIAYALYVLAREGAASIGDLRYYADVKSDDFGSPLADAHLGAALAAYGDPTRADRMFQNAYRKSIQFSDDATRSWRSDYGTNRRDRAAILTLAVESGSTAINTQALLDSIASVGDVRQFSTQEQVWSLLATQAVLKDSSLGSLSVNGAPPEGPLVKLAEDDVAFDPVAIRNDGDSSATITLTRFGVPLVSEPASGNGYAIERRYFSMTGEPVEIDSVKQGTRLVAVLTVTPFGKSDARLMVDDPLPAGFEIDNPNLMRAGDVSALDWLKLTTGTRTTEFRQERFLAAVDWRSDKPFRLGYVVRAVTPGEYRHPAASVEDMYRPTFRAVSDTGAVVITE